MKRTPMTRRTPLASGSKPLTALKPLARTSTPTRTSGPARTAPKPRKPTAPPPTLRAAQQVVRERSGWRCERCLTSLLSGGEVHHRRPRQMGGDPSPETNLPGNLVHLCGTCHAWCESNRTAAEATGWLVPRGVAVGPPASIPVTTLVGRRVLLDDDGGVATAA